MVLEVLLEVLEVLLEVLEVLLELLRLVLAPLKSYSIFNKTVRCLVKFCTRYQGHFGL